MIGFCRVKPVHVLRSVVLCLTVLIFCLMISKRVHYIISLPSGAGEFNLSNPGGWSDSVIYLKDAYHLATGQGGAHWTPQEEDLTVSVGFPYFLSWWMKMDPLIKHITPSCIVGQSCDPHIFAHALWMLKFLYILGLSLVFVSCWMLTKRFWVSYVTVVVCAFGYKVFPYTDHIMTEALSFMLVSILCFMVVISYRYQKAWVWGTVGVIWALCALTRAVYFYYFFPFLIIAMIFPYALKRKHVLVVAACFLCVVLSVMSYNKTHYGFFNLTSGKRASFSLSQRRAFLDMKPVDYTEAFFVWTHFKGSSVKFLKKHGWYTGRMGSFAGNGTLFYNADALHTKRINALLHEGLDVQKAQAKVSHDNIVYMLTHPVTYATSTLILFWGGVSIFPLLFMIYVIGILWGFYYFFRIKGDMKALWLMAYLTLANAWFIPLVAIGIPRYQVPTLPSMMVVLACGISCYLNKRQVRHDTL